LEKIKTLFFVGAFGAAVSQINVMVSRFLAYSLDSDGSLSYLFLSARLIELPIGVFAISISTVFFPELSRAFISGEGDKYDSCFARGFRLTLGIILPAAIGLALLSDTILSVLFQWGEFGGGEVDIASSVLIISCFALPFYAIAAYFVKAFHSQKDMNSPLKAAVLSFLINLVLSIILMQEYGMLGLAWANVGAAFFQTIFLATKLKGFDMKLIVLPDSLYIFSILFASLVMLGLLWFFKDQQFFAENKLHSVLELLTCIPLGILIYALSLALLGFPELKYVRKKIGLPR
jgi:putative peptidoglycan lipid II flippase